jgi:hypothetical protein
VAVPHTKFVGNFNSVALVGVVVIAVVVAAVVPLVVAMAVVVAVAAMVVVAVVVAAVVVVVLTLVLAIGVAVVSVQATRTPLIATPPPASPAILTNFRRDSCSFDMLCFAPYR